jgi:acetoin utilization deacetylase AcuC-like enzyme
VNVLLYLHDSALLHDTGPGHPERPARYRAVVEALDQLDAPWLLRQEAPEASIEQVKRVHDVAYVDALLEALPDQGLVQIDADTIGSPGSREAALRAAGAAASAVDAILSGRAKRAFSAMRPPGHHAESNRAMGFCLFNSVAVGAAQARTVHGVGRIAIVDFDVHHGNGTQEIFWSDPQTLYVSTHQSPLYPGTGADNERGARDNILNIPLRSGTDGTFFRKVVADRVIPVLDRFAPELLLISAGFDAHEADPLASLRLTEEDFAWVTKQLVAVADRHAQGRVVSVLEGGYDVDALGRSVKAHVCALAGQE